MGLINKSINEYSKWFDRDSIFKSSEHSRQVRLSLMFQYLSIKVPVHMII